MASDHVYNPLPEGTIRVFALLPPSLNNPTELYGNLRAMPFSSSPTDSIDIEPYEALSYTWGEPKFMSLIYVNNILIYITISLF
jgi:hypothetical protein